MNESLDVAMGEGDLLFLNIAQRFLLSDAHLVGLGIYEYARMCNRASQPATPRSCSFSHSFNRVGRVGRRANRCLSALQCRHRPPAPQYLLFATRLSLLPRHNSLTYSFPTYRTLLWTLFIIPILLLAPSYELPNLDCQERVP